MTATASTSLVAALYVRHNAPVWFVVLLWAILIVAVAVSFLIEMRRK